VVILAADNLNALNPIVADALLRLDRAPLQALARRCEQPGVGYIDLNPGYLSRRHEDRMAFMVEAVQEATALRLILDNPNPHVIARGLKVCRDRPVINALSLEPHKIAEMLPLAVDYRARLVLLLIDERSRVPASLEEKLAVAVELRERSVAAGMRHQDLIIDPVLPHLSWPDAFDQIAEVVNTVRLLSTGSVLEEPAATMIGLSNLRSGERQRFPLEVEQTCLQLLAGAGISLVLANVLQPELLRSVQLINRMSPGVVA
jgi:5-methyltetrahydrofolate corrinoid/iron sulfur protein methyltransferase